MAFERAFGLGLAWRVLILVLALAALAWVVALPGLHAATIVAGGLCIGIAVDLWRFIQRTNLEVARFVEALTYADFSQSFGHAREGGGFEELGRSMNTAIARLRLERSQTQDANRYLAALVDDVPTPLVSIDADDRVELLNKASRRLLGQHDGVRLDDLRVYGETFVADLVRAAIGERRTTQLEIDETPQRATLSVAEVRHAGAPVRIVAVQPIQGELDAVEMNAWRDLVRVLTHEIMNSMTPITSLAKTAAELMGEADAGRDPRVADARAAVETVARRADGVMHFVQTYRQISRSPPLRRQAIRVASLLAELEQLFRADWPSDRVTLAIAVEPSNFELYADADLIAQVLINLMRNAAEASIETSSHPQVTVRAHRNRQGRAVIEVEDNGPGVPPDKVDEVFLPFFTTKPTGTGVGLSLARQIVLAHQGALTYRRSAAGGAVFRLVI